MDEVLTATLNIPISYLGNGCFIFSYRNETNWTYETCKELACSYAKKDGYNNLSYYSKSNKFLKRIREYEALLGLPHTSFEPLKIKQYFIGDDFGFGVRITGFLNKNVVTREVGAILLKTVKVQTLLNKPADLKALLATKYFRGAKPKSIFRNLPKFLDGITPAMLNSCTYNFNGVRNHGGLLNWTSDGTFDEILKQFDK